MNQKIQLLHPEGKKAISMNKPKYDVIKEALIDHLMKRGESTHTEIWQTVAEDFKKNDIKFEGSIQWYMEWVKLDLEAKNIIERVPSTSPQKYTLKKNHA
jgi:hypothetical protein